MRHRGLRWLHRHGLERLVRYCARPALSQERLGRIDDEMLLYSLKKPTIDGRFLRLYMNIQASRPGSAVLFHQHHTGSIRKTVSNDVVKVNTGCGFKASIAAVSAASMARYSV